MAITEEGPNNLACAILHLATSSVCMLQTELDEIESLVP
jgi:hypothetical protein